MRRSFIVNTVAERNYGRERFWILLFLCVVGEK